MSTPRHGTAIHPNPSSVPPSTQSHDLGWPTNGAPAAPSRDGRHARAQRTHEAVLDGLKECLEMGILQPTAKQVAERAGVSLRGVFRHFEHLDQLLLELDKREHVRLSATIRACPIDAPTAKRIDSFLSGCARIYEGTATVRRALQCYGATSEKLERYRERQRLHGHEKILTLFDGELAALAPGERRERVHEISALTSWSQWEELRRFEGLSVARTRRVLAREMVAVLAPDAP